MELVSVPQRVDGSPSFKGQAPPSLTAPANAVGPPSIYARGDPGRFVAYQTVPSSTAISTPVSAFRSAEERGGGGGGAPPRQRMSLLHPPQPSADYIMPQVATPLTPRPDRPTPQPGPPYGGDSGMPKVVPISESPPCKKLRLTTNTGKPDIHTPLLIDTDRARSGPAYNPQVEAISPTLPSESLRDESPLRSTKEDLLQQIARVDREIAKTESQIAKLKKKKGELELAATQPQKDSEESNNASDSFSRSLPQCIYTDNRKKALEAHQQLDKLGPKIDLPLYNQPSDTPQYHENKLKYASFKSKLLEYFKARLKEKEKRETYLTTTYAKLSSEWAKRLEKMENNSKKRGKEAKNREIFEKVFPELRKQREDKERFSRVGSRIKSDADLEEIMDGLHEQELEDKKMRSYAVIPPILLDERARKRRCNNRNGIMEDPLQEYKDRQVLNLWTEQEKDIFKEKYLQHPKNFGIIKSYLERKNIADCVQYYYLSKKTQNYRQLLRKNRARTRNTRSQQHQNSSAAANAAQAVGLGVVKNEPNGVTTRQQKEQKSDQQAAGGGSVPVSVSNTNLLNSEPSNQDVSGSSNFSGANAEDSMMMDTSVPPPSQPSISEYTVQPKKKRKDDTKENPINEMDTSDEENMELNGDKGGPHNCAVCKVNLETFLQSRPLVRSQAMQYGLNEEDIQAGDRVCTSCRCKAVRRRYKPNCPIPTCPSRRGRIKRLRQFPPKWAELSEEVREAICAKYQIPPNVTKCCTACFNRISRRLNPNTSLDTPDDPGSDTTSWTDEEIDGIKKALTEVGTDWRKLSERINTKSDLQCRNFYFNFRKKYGLDVLVQEFKKSKGGDGGPPTLTDEEESGSTTSSCDEGMNPPPDQSRGPLEKKDDYDSSATVSAEESGPTETEKPASVEDMKTLPNHPDAPLQLTIRSPVVLTSGAPGVPTQHISQSISPHQGVKAQAHLNPLSSSGLVITTQASHLAAGSALSSSSGPPSFLHRGASPHGPPSHLSHGALHSGNAHPSHHNQPQNLGPPGSHSGSHGQSVASHPHMQQQQQQHMNSSSHHHHPGHPVRYSSPENNDAQEPMTVKDLMIQTIERQLRRNPVPSNSQNVAANQGGMHPGPSKSPTIQSILKSQDRSHLPPLSQHLVISQPGQNNPATSPHHLAQPANLPVSQHYQHPIYFGGAAGRGEMRGMPSHQIVAREGISIMSAQPMSAPPPARDDCETLDLSMKKRPASPPTPQRPPNAAPPPAHQPLDFTPSRQDDYFQKYSSINRTRPVQPSLAPPPSKVPKPVPPPPPLVTKPPVISPMKDGSITHGTPLPHHHPQARFSEPNANFQHNVHNRASNIRGHYPPPQASMPTKYEPLLRPTEKGSITQGTPMDKGRGKEAVSTPYMYESRPEYFKRMSPAAPYYHGSPSPYYGQRPPSTGQRSSPPTAAQSSNYSMDQQSSSRQILINDFYTSQQMQQPQQTHQPQQSPQNSVQQMGRVDPVKRNPTSGSVTPVYVLPPRHEVPYRQSPTPPQASHQRQGVIHRANPQRSVVKMEQNRYPHESALASLVDVAAAQPSLPVPKDEHRGRVGLPKVDLDRSMVREGLGKSMVEIERSRIASTQAHQSPQPYRTQGPTGHSMNPDMSRNRKEMTDGNRGFGRNSSEATDTTLTAASLIDAIITHQINQPSSHDRQSPAPAPRGDRLFASFQRSQPVNASPSHGGQQTPTSGGSYNATLHHDEIKTEDGRPVDFKNSQGGTWGDHIDLIISKDYASGKGSAPAPGSGLCGESQQQQRGSSSGSGGGSGATPVARSPVQQQSAAQQAKGDNDMAPYISWKLRRALQHEKEQQEQQQQQQQQMHQNHPDERNIIRVVQHPESQHSSSRPPSVPSSKDVNYPPVTEDGSDNPSMKHIPGSGGSVGDSFSRRSSSQNMSPLDYVKSRIVEVMRTENTEEKGEDMPANSGGSSGVESGSGGGGGGSGASGNTSISMSPKGMPTGGGGNVMHSGSGNGSTASPSSGPGSGTHTPVSKESGSMGDNNGGNRAENSQGGGKDLRPGGGGDSSGGAEGER